MTMDYLYKEASYHWPWTIYGSRLSLIYDSNESNLSLTLRYQWNTLSLTILYQCRVCFLTCLNWFQPTVDIGDLDDTCVPVACHCQVMVWPIFSASTETKCLYSVLCILYAFMSTSVRMCMHSCRQVIKLYKGTQSSTIPTVLQQQGPVVSSVRIFTPNKRWHDLKNQRAGKIMTCFVWVSYIDIVIPYYTERVSLIPLSRE